MWGRSAVQKPHLISIRMPSLANPVHYKPKIYSFLLIREALILVSMVIGSTKKQKQKQKTFIFQLPLKLRFRILANRNSAFGNPRTFLVSWHRCFSIFLAIYLAYFLPGIWICGWRWSSHEVILKMKPTQGMTQKKDKLTGAFRIVWNSDHP